MSLKIAVIGSGISGLTSAYILSQRHEVHLFEANDTLGGHTHTVTVTSDGHVANIDCGFIVFNKKTYPNFTKILDKEKVPYEKSEMSFSFYSPSKQFYYNGHSLKSLFCDTKNLYNLPFYKMLFDIVTFNRHSKKLIHRHQVEQISLKDYLTQASYGELFIECYLVPMISAIWSCPKEKVLDMPIPFLLNFYQNHGLLDIFNRPQWYVIKNGSTQYIPSLISRCKENIHLSSKVENIIRIGNQVTISVNGTTQIFDKVVIATHSDEALQMLAEPTSAEQAILGSISYEKNDIVLHSDVSVMPPQKKAWASWNYYENHNGVCSLNYYANRLQNLSLKQDFIVSVNLQNKIAKEKIYMNKTFYHPILNHQAINAQQDFPTINGVNNTYFCGAYWGNGFHEDGVLSAQRACARLQEYL
ncbi:MAG: NAD(P)/FAD-dependent oxidoreductase [Candidatus Berkiella sp.]